ncbi:MarR family winged helix-turn-helix transcriptional regulator [Streptomyces sp. NPDC091217]|uniref:MarR family winged helix-turn-helix transcriptional regulator n=1 Tax=Streptomyces sp. NPDC091217 TaxID=3365975 RepID=UPI0038211A01
MSEVAGYTGSTLSRLSNVFGRLEKCGWAQRSADPSDGRYPLAALTEEWQETVRAAAPIQVEEVRRLVLDPLTHGQQRQPDAVAQCILRALNAPCRTDWTLPVGTFLDSRK